MFNKSYLLTIVETTTDRAYSTFLSRTRCIIIFLATICTFCLMLFILSIGFRHTKRDFKLRELKRENTILKKYFNSCEKRIKDIESSLEDLHKRNFRIQNLSIHSFPDIEYGVGGPESSSRISLMEIAEVKQTDLNLTKLETELDRFRKNTAELELTVSSKMKQIAHYPSIKPIRDGWISSPFGKRLDPFTEKTENHLGIDISVNPGSKVFASAAGNVKAVRTKTIRNKGYGKYILIDHGLGYKTIYAHLSKIFVKKGQKVKRWDIIGLTGNTGKSTSPHLHYSVIVNGIPQDPTNFILE